MLSASCWPRSRETPGKTRASAWATCSKVLWLSLRSITRQSPPRSEPGPSVRGLSTVDVDIDGIMRNVLRLGAWRGAVVHLQLKVDLTTQVSYSLDWAISAIQSGGLDHA